MPLQLNCMNRESEGGPAGGKQQEAEADTCNRPGAGGPRKRRVVGSEAEVGGCEGPISEARLKAKEEKEKLAIVMGGGERKMGPEGLYVRGERLKLH